MATKRRGEKDYFFYALFLVAVGLMLIKCALSQLKKMTKNPERVGEWPHTVIADLCDPELRRWYVIPGLAVDCTKVKRDTPPIIRPENTEIPGACL